MSQYNPANLADFSAATTAIANGTVQSSGPMQSVIRDVNARIADLNDAFRALATCQAGSSAPVNRQGGIWFDASNAKWFGDPDGSGHDDDFANRIKAYGIAFATAGTGTFKLGGPINVDTVPADSYSVPANTLSADGDTLESLLCSDGTGGSTAILWQFGGITGTQTPGAVPWLSKFYIVRTGAGAQKYVSLVCPAGDATGETNLVLAGTLAATLTDANNISEQSSFNKQFFLTRLLHG